LGDYPSWHNLLSRTKKDSLRQSKSLDESPIPVVSGVVSRYVPLSRDLLVDFVLAGYYLVWYKGKVIIQDPAISPFKEL
jgi:hypothetical protein